MLNAPTGETVTGVWRKVGTKGGLWLRIEALLKRMDEDLVRKARVTHHLRGVVLDPELPLERGPERYVQSPFVILAPTRQMIPWR